MKFIKGLVSAILIILLLVVVGVIVLAFNVFNTTDETPEYVDTSLSLSSAVSEDGARALSATSTTSIVDFALDEVALNRLLGAVVGVLHEDGITFIKSAYMTFIDGAFVLYVPLKYLGISSLASAAVVFAEGDTTISATLEQVSLGSLRVVSSFSRAIFTNVMEEQTLESAFAKIGLPATVNKSDLSVTVTKDDLKNVLHDLIVGKDGTALHDVLFNVLFSTPSLLSLALGEHETLGATMALTSLAYDETRDGTNSDAFSIASAKATASQALTGGLVKRDDVLTLLSCLVFGYASLSTEEQAIADTWDLSTIGIADIKTRSADKTPKNLSLSDVLAAQVASFTLLDIATSASLSLALDEIALNKVMHDLALVGKSFAFTRETTDGTVEVATIAIEGLWFDFMASSSSLKLLISMNGCPVVIAIALSGASASALAVSLSVTGIAFGSVTLAKTDEKALLGYLATLVESEAWLSIDAEEETMTFDFTSLLPTSSTIFTALVAASGGTEVSFRGETLADDGALVIKYLLS